MRILIDTNILFSALLFPRSKPAKALLYIAQNHEMVLCDRNIAELRDILNRKAPKYLPDAEVLLPYFQNGIRRTIPSQVQNDHPDHSSASFPVPQHP